MNIMKIMQQAKSMQGKMAEIQEKMNHVQVTGLAGAGAVSITMTCRGLATAVSIKPEAIDPADPSILEDLVMAAINDARDKADKTAAEETRKMMESLGLPPDFQLPL